MKRLGETCVLLEHRTLHRHGVAVPLGERAFDILQLLIQRQGTLVTKEQMLNHVWPDNVVVENNLQVHISALRKALGNDRDLIRTLPGRGYLLVNESAAEPTPTDSTFNPPLFQPSAVTPPATPQLPLIAPLIGRDDLLDHACLALQDASTLTLTGAGGIGKTTLAIAVARQFSGTTAIPVYFVALAGLSDADQVLEALTLAAGLDIDNHKPQLLPLITHLAHTPCLIVLDNCEHLIEAAALLAEQMVRHCPQVKILATSREPLRIARERGLRVPPLLFPASGASREQILTSPSAQLFLRHMRNQNSCCANISDDQIDRQSVELISEACRRTEGIPLGLEMAATRAATLGLHELVISLQDDLASLAAGLRTTPARHQSLQASLQWSYRLLNGDEQTVLQRIACLEGRLTLDRLCAAAEPAGISRSLATDCVVGLTQKSLLMINVEGPFRSYRLLESTRACLSHPLNV
jgi:predicted ATPase/DNA-binding winged helix-turn-helix (wHTH) protein